MATIVTRAGKGSALTWTEGDSNITNLNNELATKVSSVSSTTLTVTGTTTPAVNLTSGIATAGTYTSVTVDTYGRVTAGSNPTPALATAASTVTLTADNTTAATNYPLFANAATGNLSPRTDTGFTYNPSTGALTAVSFSGSLSGNAASATQVTAVADDTTNATNYPLFANSASGNISPRTDTGFTYNPSSGTLTSSLFVGSLQGAHNGTVGAGTPNTGAFTTISASTTGTSGALTVTYNPATASGTAVQLTGKDSQGGTGYFDFLKTTNTTTGATNANKTFRTNSTGQLEIINSAYSSVILALTDAGNLQVPSISSSGSLSFKDTREAIYDLGTTGGTIAPNAANGSVQKITLNAALTINGFTSPVAGQSVTLIITGGTAYTAITSTMKFAGGDKSLTGTAGAIDILSIYYDGTNYFASLGKGFA